MNRILFIITFSLIIMGCNKKHKEQKKFEHKYYKIVCINGNKFIREKTMPSKKESLKGPIGFCDVA